MLHSTRRYNQAFIALGSNLENPVSHIQQAYLDLSALPDTTVQKRSSLYKSEPIGLIDQPDFINAVTEIETALQPLELLEKLLNIEKQHGRIRNSDSYPNAPRTLDLDVLLYGALQLKHKQLILPHPRMLQRAFVLLPLLEIAPDCEIAGHGKIKEYLADCSDQIIERLDIIQLKPVKSQFKQP